MDIHEYQGKVMGEKISVIILCYNEEKNIERSVRSILLQTYKNFELIIVDDCSTDCSPEIIQQLSKEDDRIVFLRNASNYGCGKSANIALKAASGKYIARLDADDISETTRLEKQVDYMEKHSECVLCATFADCDNGEELKIQGKYIGDIKKRFVKNNPIVQSTVMFRRTICEKRVLYPELRVFEDYKLWIDLASMGEIYVIPEILVHRYDYNNLSNKKTWEGLNKIDVYRKLLKSQIYAIEKTEKLNYKFYGIVCILGTVAKIAISYPLIWVKGL